MQYTLVGSEVRDILHQFEFRQTMLPGGESGVAGSLVGMADGLGFGYPCSGYRLRFLR